MGLKSRHQQSVVNHAADIFAAVNYFLCTNSPFIWDNGIQLSTYYTWIFDSRFTNLDNDLLKTKCILKDLNTLLADKWLYIHFFLSSWAKDHILTWTLTLLHFFCTKQTINDFDFLYTPASQVWQSISLTHFYWFCSSFRNRQPLWFLLLLVGCFSEMISAERVMAPWIAATASSKVVSDGRLGGKRPRLLLLATTDSSEGCVWMIGPQNSLLQYFLQNLKAQRWTGLELAAHEPHVWKDKRN